MPLLSTTMVNVSLLNLAAELHASLSMIQWVTSGYLLALALILPAPSVSRGARLEPSTLATGEKT